MRENEKRKVRKKPNVFCVFACVPFVFVCVNVSCVCVCVRVHLCVLYLCVCVLCVWGSPVVLPSARASLPSRQDGCKRFSEDYITVRCY